MHVRGLIFFCQSSVSARVPYRTTARHKRLKKFSSSQRPCILTRRNGRNLSSLVLQSGAEALKLITDRSQHTNTTILFSHPTKRFGTSPTNSFPSHIEVLKSRSILKVAMCRKRVLLSHALISLWVSSSLAQQDTQDDAFDIRSTRATSKPWYSSDTSIFGFTIPVSPVTLLISILAIWNIYRELIKASRATGSHILLDDSSDATKKKLEAAKKEIGNDPNKFAKYAREHSQCPSKENGGFLGTWKRGDMDPNFDKAAFDPLNEVNTTIGPVKTHFGYHLLFIKERTLIDK